VMIAAERSAASAIRPATIAPPRSRYRARTGKCLIRCPHWSPSSVAHNSEQCWIDQGSDKAEQDALREPSGETGHDPHGG
jgi:hypothetical protein